MEMIQAFAAFFVAFAVAAAVVQVLTSYALQVISEKNELPEFASFISWVPLLQVYPFIKVGGGNFKTFLLVGVGGGFGLCVAAGVLAAMLGDLGPVVAGLVLAAFMVAAVVYFVRIAMGTAERRGLPKWVGLLAFVPVVNFAVYPYIAFHDGFRPPNKLGLLLGLLLAFGPLPGQIAMMNTFSQQAQEMAQTDLGDGVTMEQAMAGLGAAMEIGTELAMLDGMDPSDPEQARQMQESIADLKGRIEENRATLGAEAVADMEGMIAYQEKRLANPSQPLPEEMAGEMAMVDDEAPMDALAPDTSPPALYDPPTLSAGPPLTAKIPRNGDQGFAIPVAPDCPQGTHRQGAAPPAGSQTWCEKMGSDAGIKHGWMTEYWDNGKPKVAGEYRDGLRVGVWSRFYEDGTKRVQAEFVDGLQDGVLLSWNPDGSLAFEKRFSQGAPASR